MINNKFREMIQTEIKLALCAMVYGTCTYISNNWGNRDYYSRPKHDRYYSHSNATYGDAVSAIARSNMFDICKQEAIFYVKKDQKADYYDCVIDIANSAMSDRYKMETIRDLKW